MSSQTNEPDLGALLSTFAAKGATAIYLAPDRAPFYRVDDNVARDADTTEWTATQIMDALKGSVSEFEAKRYEKHGELDFTMTVGGTKFCGHATRTRTGEPAAWFTNAA